MSPEVHQFECDPVYRENPIEFPDRGRLLVACSVKNTDVKFNMTYPSTKWYMEESTVNEWKEKAMKNPKEYFGGTNAFVESVETPNDELTRFIEEKLIDKGFRTGFEADKGKFILTFRKP